MRNHEFRQVRDEWQIYGKMLVDKNFATDLEVIFIILGSKVDWEPYAGSWWFFVGYLPEFGVKSLIRTFAAQ